jgi:hypothetical protein
MIQQHRMDSDEATTPQAVKDSALMLADKLEDLFDGRDDLESREGATISNMQKMNEYVDALAYKLREFRTQVEPSSNPAPAAGAPPAPEQPTKPKDKPKGPDPDSVVGRERMMRHELS